MRVSLLDAITNAGMANVSFAVSGRSTVVTAQNDVTLTGTAPLEVQTILVNGEQYFVTWSTLKNWSVQVNLFGYTNTLLLQGINSLGRPVAGASAVITVIDMIAPKDYTYIPYTQAGQVYTQNFDSLPNPGATTVNSDNPVTINGLVYSLGDPFAFGAPIADTGDGGLGLPFALSGWYGWGAAEAKFGASTGDQTTGGVISFGPTNSAGTNRALGLLATSSTGPTAFAAKFVNLSGAPLNMMSLSYTGELWRQNGAAKTVSLGYYLDPTATNVFSTSVTAWVTSLDPSFPTGPEGAQDGTAAANQIGLSVTNQAIGEWMPGGALWLVWLMADPTGKGQGLAIDNLSFSASALPALTAQAVGSGVEVLWPLSFAGFTLQQNSYLDQGAGWTNVALPVSTNGGWYSVTVPATNAVQFFRLKR
jgi:hypothetical protein